MRHACAIVQRAVINTIALGIGLTDAQVIVMRRVNHHFIAQHRIGAAQQTQDVGAAGAIHSIRQLQRCGDSQGHGMKIPLLRRFDQLIQILAGQRY